MFCMSKVQPFHAFWLWLQRANLAFGAKIQWRLICESKVLFGSLSFRFQIFRYSSHHHPISSILGRLFMSATTSDWSDAQSYQNENNNMRWLNVGEWFQSSPTTHNRNPQWCMEQPLHNCSASFAPKVSTARFVRTTTKADRHTLSYSSKNSQ